MDNSNKKIFNWQFETNDIINTNDLNIINRSIWVVIAKPTRVCNADCSYCSSPPLEEMGDNWEPEWNFEKFKVYFDKTFPLMMDGSYWIWHGGEPMLMGVEFYKKTYAYAKEQMKKYNKQVNFSMQSNMLGYNKKWKEVFSEVFHGSISTSFDPDEKNRTIKKNPENYSKVFKRVLNEILEDGFKPMVIGTYSEDTAYLMDKMYNWSKSLNEKSFPIRFNYCTPSGRFLNEGELISPKTYANSLIDLYNKWIKDDVNFTITPLDQMFKKVIGKDSEGHCPWTRKCGGRFIEIEPNGDVYNCSEFADYNKKYCFGNLNDNSLKDLLSSKPAKNIKRRVTQLPNSCQTCEHFNECEGGCARDSALFQNGLYGKFHYCESWKIVFSRIKESILLGEADNLIKKYNFNPEDIKKFVKENINSQFNNYKINWDLFYTKKLKSIYGFGNNIHNLDNANNYSAKGEFIPFLEEEVNYVEEDLKINQKLEKIKIIVKN